MEQIAFLLTCHNRKDNTINCLDLLYRCKVPVGYAFDIFLVDDGCNDGTAEAVSIRYPGVYILKGSGYLYWNRGMHLAWKTAKKSNDYDYYLWLNDDTLLFDTAIEELLICNQVNKGNSIVCGAICSNLTGKFTYGGRGIGGEEIIPNGDVQTCHTINGNCVLINRKICSIVGLLDPIYPHAIGDYEYGLRAIKKGFSVITTRSFIGECERNASLPKWCYGNISLRERFRSLYSPLGNSHPRYFFIFERKYYGLLPALKHYFSIHLRVLMPSLWK